MYEQMFIFQYLALTLLKVKATRPLLCLRLSFSPNLPAQEVSAKLAGTLVRTGCGKKRHFKIHILTIWPVVKVTASNFYCLLAKRTVTFYLLSTFNNSNINSFQDMNKCVSFNIWPWTWSRLKLHAWLGVRTELPSSPAYSESRSLNVP